MSNLTVGQLSSNDPITNLITVASGDTVYSPGSVVQMVNTTIYTPTAVAVPASATSNTNIPDLTCSITPKKSSSRVYVQVRWFGEFTPNSANWNSMFGLKRNGTAVGVNPSTAGGATGIAMGALGYNLTDANSTPEVMFFDFYDSPATTSAVVYQAYINCTDSGTTLYTNRTVAAAAAGYEYGSSTITLWEIAQ